MTVEEILKRVEQIGRDAGVKKILLFGSFAKGTAHAKSDIDLAVYGAADFDTFAEDVRNIPTLRSFDIVNMDHCRNRLLMEEIETYGWEILS